MGTRSSLFIANVNGVQGLYTCKATNDYGSEMSSAGELKRKGNTIFSTVVSSSNSQRQAWRKALSATCFHVVFSSGYLPFEFILFYS